jgi:hypothetical protein
MICSSHDDAMHGSMELVVLQCAPPSIGRFHHFVGAARIIACSF